MMRLSKKPWMIRAYEMQDQVEAAIEHGAQISRPAVHRVPRNPSRKQDTNGKAPGCSQVKVLLCTAIIA